MDSRRHIASLTRTDFFSLYVSSPWDKISSLGFVSIGENKAGDGDILLMVYSLPLDVAHSKSYIWSNASNPNDFSDGKLKSSCDGSVGFLASGYFLDGLDFLSSLGFFFDYF